VVRWVPGTTGPSSAWNTPALAICRSSSFTVGCFASMAPLLLARPDPGSPNARPMSERTDRYAAAARSRSRRRAGLRRARRASR
jgi:hypothetical protein